MSVQLLTADQTGRTVDTAVLTADLTQINVTVPSTGGSVPGSRKPRAPRHTAPTFAPLIHPAIHAASSTTEDDDTITVRLVFGEPPAARKRRHAHDLLLKF